MRKLHSEGIAYVVDGNHRIAISAALGRSLSAEVWPLDLAFLKFSKVSEFYGTENHDMPYQGVYLGSKELIQGRRKDLVQRLNMIPDEAIVDQSILDVASNVGMSSLLAYSLGAKQCLGIEVSQPMVDIAARFSMFNNSYSNVQYRKVDLNNTKLSQDEIFDTAFMFSIHDHLSNPSILLEIAKYNVRKFVVFEGHPGGKAEDYSNFLDSSIFESVIELGTLHTSRFKQDNRRTLWLCRKQ